MPCSLVLVPIVGANVVAVDGGVDELLVQLNSLNLILNRVRISGGLSFSLLNTYSVTLHSSLIRTVHYYYF